MKSVDNPVDSVDIPRIYDLCISCRRIYRISGFPIIPNWASGGKGVHTDCIKMHNITVSVKLYSLYGVDNHLPA